MNPIGSMGLVYLPTFWLNFSYMWAHIPYMDPWVYSQIYTKSLKYFLCSPLLVEVIKRINLTNIFQVDPNHQLEIMIRYITLINKKCVHIYEYRLASLQVRWEGAVEKNIYIYICLFQWIDWPQLQRNDMGRTLVRVMKVTVMHHIDCRKDC